jgi:hypothetical protein
VFLVFGDVEDGWEDDVDWEGEVANKENVLVVQSLRTGE